jgi:hypothetical protein
MTKQIETLMALADECASLTSQDEERDALKKALEAALKPSGEVVAKYIGECPDGSLIQLYDDLKKGTELYTAPTEQTSPPRLTDEMLRDCLRECPPDAIEPLRTRWLYAKDFARAVETAVRKQFGASNE